MQRLVAAALFGLTTANNIVSPATKKCLDIKAMCKDCDETVDADDEEKGCDRAGCDREEPEDLKRGARLHMWTCHNDENQNFEIIGGRIKNKAAGRTAEHAELCIDIKALCEDGTDTPGCTRQSVDDMTEEAEIQLWTCRGDDEKGRSSSSYGNQKWDILGNGYFQNELTGLCLVAHHDDAESGADATNGAKVHVHTCPEGTEVDPEFVFDFETGDLAEETNADADAQRLFSVGAVVQAKGSPAPALAAAACVLGLVAAAAAAFVRSRRVPAASQLPLTASE